jgi:hypothetical protein
VISGTTDGPYLVNGLKDCQQVEVKAAQIEHGTTIDFDVGLLIESNYHKCRSRRSAEQPARGAC